jgi:hypothetical protein
VNKKLWISGEFAEMVQVKSDALHNIGLGAISTHLIRPWIKAT